MYPRDKVGAQQTVSGGLLVKRKGLCTHDQDLHQTCYRSDSRVSRCEVIKVPAMLSCSVPHVPHVPSACSACVTCDAPFEQSMLADSGLGWVKYNADVPVSTSLPNALPRFSLSRQPTDQLASPPLDRSALGLPRSANCTLHYNLIMQHFAERAEAKDEAGSDMDKAAQCTGLWPPRATALPLRSNMGWFKPRRYAPVA